jgi:small subunit ribosomal protein S7
MSRRRKAEKRLVSPDYKYGSVLVTKFINNMMLDGKRRIAENIFYSALEKIVKEQGKDGVEVFKKALENVKPQLEVKTRRVGGANYQVPIEVAPNRSNALAIRWVILNSRKRSEHTMSDRLSAELWQAFNNEGGAVRKKVEVHKMAEANKAFAHFRW